jgi:hypothetical protein
MVVRGIAFLPILRRDLLSRGEANFARLFYERGLRPDCAIVCDSSCIDDDFGGEVFKTKEEIWQLSVF